MLSIQVQYFAVLRERKDCSTEHVQCQEGTTVADLYQNLFPPSEGGQIQVGYAVNLNQVSGETLLKTGDEVAFLPPIGGG